VFRGLALVSILCFLSMSALGAHPDTRDGERFCTIANPPAAQGENYWQQIFDGLRSLQQEINPHIPERVAFCPNPAVNSTACDYCNRSIRSLHTALDHQQNASDRKFCREEKTIANITQTLQSQVAMLAAGPVGQREAQQALQQAIQSCTDIAAAYRRMFEEAVPCQTLYIAVHHYCGYVNQENPPEDVRALRERSDRAKTYCFQLTGWSQNGEAQAQASCRQFAAQLEEVNRNLAAMSGAATPEPGVADAPPPSTGDFFTSRLAVGTDDERKAAAIAYVREHPDRRGMQCAAYIQHPDLRAGLPHTTRWRAGTRVLDSPPPIGTPVATFNIPGADGTMRYGGISGRSHSGIYMGRCDEDGEPGILLLHSYRAQALGDEISCVTDSTWDDGTQQEGPGRYFTIVEAPR
jgi:hypothetical protein